MTGPARGWEHPARERPRARTATTAGEWSACASCGSTSPSTWTKQGHAYTVTEHGQEVAVLRPVVRSESVLDRLVAEGKAVAPQRPMRDLPAPVTIALESPLSQVLRQMRDEERW